MRQNFATELMTSKASLIVFLSASFAMAVVTADEIASHKARMDTAQDLVAELSDALDAKAAPSVARSAHALAEICRQEKQYWEKTKLSDAIQLAKDNLAQAEQIEAAADGGHLDQAQPVYAKLKETCRTCHDSHPEKRVNQSTSEKQAEIGPPNAEIRYGYDLWDRHGLTRLQIRHAESTRVSSDLHDCLPPYPSDGPPLVSPGLWR